MSENNDYKNLEFEGNADGVSKLETLREELPDVSEIRWGRKFEDWSDYKKIDYLKELASSLNHAAELLQNERNELLQLLRRKEDMIISLNERLEDQGVMLHRELQKAGAEKQELMQRVVELDRRVKKQQAKIEALRGGREVNDGKG